MSECNKLPPGVAECSAYQSLKACKYIFQPKVSKGEEKTGLKEKLSNSPRWGMKRAPHCTAGGAKDYQV